MRATALSFLFFFVIVSAVAQEPGDEVQLFFKDQQTPVDAIYQDYKFSSNKFVLQMNGETRRIHVKKLDSIHTANDTFLVKRINARPHHLRVLSRGTITLYQYEGERVFLQYGDLKIYPIEKSPIAAEHHEFLTSDHIEEIEQHTKFSRDSLTAHYDSLRTAAPLFVFRIGVFLPSLGFELGITKRLTFANSISANFFGPLVRDARTVVNFHTYHQLRFFIGYDKRLEKGKSNYKYSGFFTAPTFHYLMDIGRQPVRVLGWSVGFQDDIMFNKAASTSFIGFGIDPISRAFFITTGIAFGLAF
jgi:hypothetical protein